MKCRRHGRAAELAAGRSIGPRGGVRDGEARTYTDRTVLGRPEPSRRAAVVTWWSIPQPAAPDRAPMSMQREQRGLHPDRAGRRPDDHRRLAAIALPCFVDLQRDARIGHLQGARGAVATGATPAPCRRAGELVASRRRRSVPGIALASRRQRPRGRWHRLQRRGRRRPDRHATRHSDRSRHRRHRLGRGNGGAFVPRRPISPPRATVAVWSPAVSTTFSAFDARQPAKPAASPTPNRRSPERQATFFFCRDHRVPNGYLPRPTRPFGPAPPRKRTRLHPIRTRRRHHHPRHPRRGRGAEVHRPLDRRPQRVGQGRRRAPASGRRSTSRRARRQRQRRRPERRNICNSSSAPRKPVADGQTSDPPWSASVHHRRPVPGRRARATAAYRVDRQRRDLGHATPEGTGVAVKNATRRAPLSECRSTEAA